MKDFEIKATKQNLQTVAFLIFLGFLALLFALRLFVTNAEKDSLPVADTKPTENHLPEIADLHYKEIGVGQRLFFGVEVIDEEGDNVRIELAEKPKTAKFNQNTLTVDWTPTASDGDNGKFLVKVTELPRDKSRAERSVTREYNVKIVKNPVKLLELPITSLEVDSFVTIIDPERLKAADKKWNIVSLFQRIGEIEAEKQIKAGSNIQPSNGKQLFLDSMKELAIMHKNPTLDPDSPQFDKVWNAENWKLIAVRPRINKKVFELRLVYFNIKAAEQAYLMPRMRIIRGGDASRPDDLRQKNNYQFAKMFHEAFFDGANMKPFVANDKAKYGEALAEFITKVLTYNDKSEPMMKANMAAIPHNSRLGGGNEYDANGKYLFGDGWALGAMKVAPVERNGKKVLAVVSPPIDGFVASIKANADGTAFKPFAPPVADKDNDEHRAGWENLINEDGTLFIPEVSADGSIKPLNIDTTINSFEYKYKLQTAETALQDPRRRLFEEKGMTCMQCHVRNYDEGDYLTSVQIPKEMPKDMYARTIPRVFFIITPTLHSGRNEYIHREEQEQVGNLQGVFRDYLGINVKINSPLALDWVHGTKKGRS
ncbi:hypothetical protein BH20ACI4_BH20ACI4_15840 [soil metagenome]